MNADCGLRIAEWMTELTPSPWPAMLAVSFLTSILILLVFRVTSNRASVRRKKDRLLARVLELALFKDDIVVNLGAFKRVMAANLSYLAELIKPLCLNVLIFVLILPQVSAWFGAHPLRPGEAVILTARFLEEFPVMEQAVSLEPSAAIAVETDAVRIPSKNEISWRIRADRSRQERSGNSWIDVNINGEKIRKEVTISRTLAQTSRIRLPRGFWNELKNPAEPPLPQDSPLASIEVRYPQHEFALGKLPLNWTGAFIVLTLLFGFLLKKPLGVVI